MARLLGRRGWWALGLTTGIGAMSVAGLMFLPDAGLRWGLIRTLRDYGMIEVSVADSVLSLFDGHLVVRDIVARPPLGDALGIDDFALNFRWMPLFRRQVVIDRMALTGVTIDIKRAAGSDVIVINGLPLATGEPDVVAGEGASEPPPKPVAKGPIWGIDLTELDLRDSRLHLESGPLVADIAIKQLHVTNLHSRKPDQPVAFSLDGSLNGAPVTLAGSLLPFAVEPSFSVETAAHGLDLTAIAAGLEEIGLTAAKGTAELTATITGRLAADGPHIEGKGRLDIAQAGLVKPLTFRADRFAIDLASASWGGSTLDLSGTADATNLAITIAPGQTIGAATARLEAPVARLAEAHLTAQGNLSIEKFIFKGKPEITAAQAMWRGDIETDRGAPCRIGGTLETSSFRLNDPDLLATLQRATVEGKLATTPANASLPIRSEGPLTITFDGGRLSADKTIATIAQGKLIGKLDTAPARSALPLALPGLTRLELHDARLTTPEVVAGLARAEVSATVEPVPAKSAMPLAVRGTASGERIAVGPPHGGEEWLAVERVGGEGLALAADGHASADRITATGLAALRRRGQGGYYWRFEARTLRLDHPTHDGRDTRTGEVRLDDLTVRLTRTGAGLLGFVREATAHAPTGRRPALPRVTVSRLTVAGNSRLSFEDRTLPEPFRLEAQPLELTVERLDSLHPDRDSPFRLSAAIGGAHFEASGGLRPFASPPGGRIDSKISALELPPLSPYVADTLGLQLRTGHFDGTVRGEARDGGLDGVIDLTLSNLDIAAPDPHAPLLKRTGLPIETVLDLLRGGDGRIRLSIPVKGQLDSPDFDFSDAINQAVGGALSSAVTSTLKLAFPLTALISLIDDDGDGRLTLAPVRFAPGEATLPAEQRHILDQAAKLLKERNTLHLTACGKAILTEGPQLAAQRRPWYSRLIGVDTAPSTGGPSPEDLAALRALADRRGAAAKNYLVEQAGVPAEQVFTCRGEIEDGADAFPRVDLQL